MHQWRTRLHSLHRVNHRRKQFPLNLYQIQCVFRYIAVLSSYRHNCFTKVAHFIESNRTLDNRLGTEGWHWINYFGSLTTSQYSMDAKEQFRCAGIDADNACMRIGTTQYSDKYCLTRPYESPRRLEWGSS